MFRPSNGSVLDRIDDDGLTRALLPGLPIDLIRASYGAAPGNEIASGKFASAESSAALAANVFGPFLARPTDLQPPPVGAAWGWPASSVRLEATVRFPWKGGRHPCLDALIATPLALIGVESKRYEPFRAKSAVALAETYWRPEWGDAMAGYQHVRDKLGENAAIFRRLDAAQLIKHALALRTAVHQSEFAGRQAVLLYLYAEPRQWSNQRQVSSAAIDRHRTEIGTFAAMVAGDEVGFHACSYRQLLSGWIAGANPLCRSHAAALADRFDL